MIEHRYGKGVLSMADALEKRIEELERRVAEVEGAFGFLLPLTKQVHRDLIGFRKMTEDRFTEIETRFEEVEGRLGGVEGRLDGVEGRLGGVEGRLEKVEFDLGLVQKKQEVHTDMMAGLPRLIVEMLKTEGFIAKP